MAKRTKRKNTRRRVSKKNNKTRKRRQRKRNKIGGSGFFSQKINEKLENLTVEGEELKRKADRLEAQSTYWKVSPKQDPGSAQVAATPEPAAVAEPVEPEPAPGSENPLAFNILNKFFREVYGWFGRKLYELDPTKLGPNNKINVISAHGYSIPDIFFVVPKGLTLYLPVAGEDYAHNLGSTTRRLNPFGNDPNKLNYIREYKGGSLIQDYFIDFDPFYDEYYNRFASCGLIKLDLPHLSVKNATEANNSLIDFLSKQRKYLSGDLLSDRKDKEESGDIRVHLETYEDVYFENNIDDIIDKNDLIESATRQKQYYLSDILRLIARKRKINSSISGVWFGRFCRSGEFIDINKFRDCQENGLPSLPESFFQGDFHYEGISAELVRQESLASSDSTINFKKILNEVYEKREQYDKMFFFYFK
jgi:hypothetical protein